MTIVGGLKTRMLALAVVLAGVVAVDAGLAAGATDRVVRWDALTARAPWLSVGAPVFGSERFADSLAGDHLLARLGLPPVPAGSTPPNYLLVADRENNRLIILSPAKKIVWRFPPLRGPGSHARLPGPDDAFVSANRQDLSVNQEFNDTIRLISLSTHPTIVWRYGHATAQGSAHGYLAHPDDAYELANGDIQVADIINCRILWINRAKRIVHSLGRAGECVHNPPATLSDPNGDTPLSGGGVLVTEIGGWVDRFSATGRLVWSISTPTTYPSDAQPLPNGNVLVASYTDPGRIDILTPKGRVVWSYDFSRGRRALNYPSLAMPMPGHLIVANDDYDDRVVVINRATKKIVWQYGHNGVPGSGPGYLNTPDGLELLP